MYIKDKNLYDWQKKYIKHLGNTTMRGGRQIGKSMTTAKRILYLANKYPGETHLIIASSERQENYLLDKVKIELGKDYCFRARATKYKLPLENGTDIYKFPVGKTGVYVEGLSSVSFLWIDEAIHMSEKVYNSIIPMLAEPRKRGLGWINLLSATKGKARGFFFDSFKSKKFYKVHEKAEDQPHISKEFLKEELNRLGKRLYNVIYNGEFDILGDCYFPPDLIDEAINFKFFSLKRDYKPYASYYLGTDPAFAGKCKAGFVISEINKDRIKIPHWETMEKTRLRDLVNKTRELDNLFHWKKNFVDNNGCGIGLNNILEDEFGSKRIRGLNGATKGKDKKILKEDLYSNALRLFELRKLDLPNDEVFINALKKVYINKEGIIKGNDIADAFIRACWAIKEKSLKCRIITF